jgi:hypothetical protein
MQAPPGGPEDREPPQLIRTSPDSGAVNFRSRAVEFRFDEVISDRGTGAAALPQLVLVSPRDGTPRVAWRREAIAVRPRSGWRPNITYTVTVLPGVADLRGNTTRTGRTVVISTGATQSQFTLQGRVFDWMAERPAARAWVEAISRPDSIVYVAVSDSAGMFTVGPLLPGTYTLRGFIDQNNNRALDRSEAWDSLTAQPPRAGVQTSFELLAAPRDTIPPRIAGIAVTDSVTLTVEFDRPLHPGRALTPGLFALVRADSTPVPIVEVTTRAEAERREEARRAAADSARADSARADSARARRAAADTARARPPARDTSRAARPARPAPQQPQLVRGPESQTRPSRPPPPQQVVLRTGAPFVAGTSYRLTVTGVANLLGRSGSSTRVFQVPRPAPPDTTRAAPRPPR